MFAEQSDYDNSAMDSMYMNEVDEQNQEILPYNAANSYNVNMDDSDDENRNLASFSVEEYIGDLQSKASAPRPQSAPAGRRGILQDGETLTPSRPEIVAQKSPSRLNAQYLDNDVHIAESVKLPSSPYDEEIAFEYLPEDDEDLDSAYLDSRRGSTAAHVTYTSNTVSGGVASGEHWEEENRRYLMASTDADIPAAPVQKQIRPRPSSADPRLRQSAPGVRSSSAGRFGTSFSSTALATRQGRYSLVDSTSHTQRRSSSTDRARLRVSSARNSTERLDAMKELVEDLVRNTAKKADLYHMIQVSLGFIDDYMLVPPRGAIITGKRKVWLTTRDLQTAFMSARLCLTEPHVLILRSLVNSFAQNYNLLYPEGNLASSSVNKSMEGSTTNGKKGVFGPQQTLSSEWLKKYLVHLRLSKKVAAVATTTPGAEVGTFTAQPVGAAGSTTEGEQAQEKAPLAWSEWLGKKMQREVKRDAGKPRDFEKALNGQPHPLSKEDVELMLRTYNVLPAEVLQQEVECRIESWLLDMDGRRDFQHELNVKIRHWIWTKKLSDNIKMPQNEKGYWQIWQKLPEEEKKAVKAEIISTIIQEKRADLLSKERTKQTITKELFWKFDGERHKKESKWAAWLPEHIAKFKKDLSEFRRTEQDRLVRVANIQSKRQTVAGLNEVQAKLKKVQDDYQMDSYHQIELQKAINALRRSAVVSNVAKGTVITKEEFDRHIKGILAPYITLDDAAVPAASPQSARGAPSRGPIKPADLQGMFHQELKVAVGKVVELEKERTEKASKAYKDWLGEKKAKLGQLAAKKVR